MTIADNNPALLLRRRSAAGRHKVLLPRTRAKRPSQRPVFACLQKRIHVLPRPLAPVPVRKDVTQSRKPHPLTHQIVFLSRWRRYCSTGGECCATVCARTLCKADRPTHSFVLQEVIESEREYVRRLQMATEVSSCPEIGSSSAVLHGNSGFY